MFPNDMQHQRPVPIARHPYLSPHPLLCGCTCRMIRSQPATIESNLPHRDHSRVVEQQLQLGLRGSGLSCGMVEVPRVESSAETNTHVTSPTSQRCARLPRVGRRYERTPGSIVRERIAKQRARVTGIKMDVAVDHHRNPGQGEPNAATTEVSRWRLGPIDARFRARHCNPTSAHTEPPDLGDCMRQRKRSARSWQGCLAASLLFAVAAGTAVPATSLAQPVLEPSELLVDLSSFVHQRVLDNGLTVVVVDVPSLPIVTIELAVRNGAFTETAEFNGLSHLYEHMFFKANAVLPSQEEYMARQRALGMVWNGTTSTERVNYFFTLPSANLAEGLAFMRDAIQTPLFREDELVREREVVLGEYDRNEASPFYWLYQAVDGLLWSAHPSRKDSLGDRQTISTATVAQMTWMQQTYYVPNNALLVLSGDVRAAAGFAMAEELFGGWERAEDPHEAHPVPEHPPLAQHVTAVVEQPVQVSFLQFAWHGPDTRNDIPATYAADVFSFAIAQDDSRFQTALVESGIALQANLGYSTQRYTGPIQLTVALLPGQEEAVIAAVLEQIAQFDDDSYLTDAQIQAAMTALSIDDLYTQQSSEALAHTISYWWASATIEYYLNYIQNLQRVTREDMRRYVRTYIQGRPFATVLMAEASYLRAGGIDPQWLLARVAPSPSQSEAE